MGRASDAGSSREGLGFFFVLLLVYLGFEYGRPPDPMKIPMLVSLLSLGGWVIRRDKRWCRQSSYLVLLLMVMAVGIPLAGNTYSAFWATYGMAVLFLCICVPLPSVVTSVRRIRVWMYTFVAVSMYVGVWAIGHGGYGPSGAGGAQDENYVAAMMSMAIPLAYFSMVAETRRIARALLVLAILVLCAAVVVANNVSRGGFLGLCAAIAYCVARSPRKRVAMGVVAAIAVVFLAFAGPRYWEDIATIGDVNEGTADTRLEIWKIGMRMFGAHPVLGVGAGNFRWEVGRYQSTEQLSKFGRNLGASIIAHSLFVELLAELGLAGAIVLLLSLGATWMDYRTIQRTAARLSGSGRVPGEVERLRSYSDAVVGSLVACLVNGVFLSLLYFSYLWLLIALAAAVTQVFRVTVSREAAAPGRA